MVDPVLERELRDLPTNAAFIRRHGDQQRLVRGPAILCLGAIVEDREQDRELDDDSALGDECFVPLDATDLAARCIERDVLFLECPDFPM